MFAWFYLIAMALEMDAAMNNIAAAKQVISTLFQNSWCAVDFGLGLVMWFIMVLGMMLPVMVIQEYQG